jgi:exopolysaccharide biosynthesis polyprenyl glycosylphosphotransferase
MLREQSRQIVIIHQGLDIALTVIAFVSAYVIKRYLPAPFGGLITEPNYYVILLMIIIIWYMTFALCGLYESYRKRNLLRILWEMTRAVFIGMVVLVIGLYLLKIKDISRLLMGIFCVFDIILLGLSKSIVYRILTTYRTKGFNYRNILVVGSKQRAKDTINLIGAHPFAGLRVMGCVETDEALLGQEVSKGVNVIGLLSDLRDLLRNRIVDEMIFAMPLSKIPKPHQYMLIAEQLGVAVRILPDWHIHNNDYQPRIAKTVFEDFFGYPTLALSTTTRSKDNLFVKYAFDYVFSILAFIVFLPFFVVISIVIKIFSKGPVLYRQERCGLNGRRFMLYKFRTMLVDAEKRQRELEAANEADGPVFKIRNDPRIIPWIGKLLRKTSMDELPQLINILKGEMSLVGPRPPIPAEVEKYDDWQRRRLSMKPGLTCIWQITRHRNDVSFGDWMRMDLEYIDTWSLKLDFEILFKTLAVVLFGSGR